MYTCSPAPEVAAVSLRLGASTVGQQRAGADLEENKGQTGEGEGGG